MRTLWHLEADADTIRLKLEAVLDSQYDSTLNSSKRSTCHEKISKLKTSPLGDARLPGYFLHTYRLGKMQHACISLKARSLGLFG